MNKKLQSIIKNLDSYRNGKNPKIKVTDEQKEFLVACREHDIPVSWDKVAELWDKIGWGRVSATAMRNRYKLVKGIK